MSRSYVTVTELPGSGATREQLAMLYTRYSFAVELCDGKAVLEVACGPGLGLGYLARKARRVIGGEYDHELLRIAQEHYDRRLSLVQFDGHALPFRDHSFDVVILFEAIYYLRHVGRFLDESRRVLRNGGLVLICSANRERPGFNRSPLAFSYFSASELSLLLTKKGFEVELFAGFPVAPSGFRSRVLTAGRQVAVALHLIPKTMRSKERLKRLVFGKLSPLPTEVSEGMAELGSLVSLDGNSVVSGYKVLYALGRIR